MATYLTPNKVTERTEFTTPAPPTITIPASPLLKRLGYGTGVSVFRLERSPKIGSTQSPWAIKCLNKNKQIPEKTVHAERLHKEASLLRKLNHPNIVGFRGFNKLQDGREILAMEDCEISLGDLIESRKEVLDIPYPADVIMKVASDMSRALDYLHNEALILHADIKSYNVLVLENFKSCKLCDFGVSIPLKKDGFVDTTKCEDMFFEGTDIWAAPETEIYSLGDITSKSDIFSLGLTLWEMLALEPPPIPSDYSFSNVTDNDDSVESLNSTSSCNLSGTSDTNTFKGRVRPLLPAYNLDATYNHVLELYYVMTEEFPERRLSAEHLVECIQNMTAKSM